MEIIAYLLGFTLIACCTYFNLYTSQAVNALKGIYKEYPLKYLSVFPAVFAIWFFISAPLSKCPWPFIIIGILATIEAIVAFTNPQKIYSKVLDWLFDNTSNQAYRLFSILGIILGTLIMTLVR